MCPEPSLLDSSRRRSCLGMPEPVRRWTLGSPAPTSWSLVLPFTAVHRVASGNRVAVPRFVPPNTDGTRVASGIPLIRVAAALALALHAGCVSSSPLVEGPDSGVCLSAPDGSEFAALTADDRPLHFNPTTEVRVDSHVVSLLERENGKTVWVSAVGADVALKWVGATDATQVFIETPLPGSLPEGGRLRFRRAATATGEWTSQFQLDVEATLESVSLCGYDDNAVVSTISVRTGSDVESRCAQLAFIPTGASLATWQRTMDIHGRYAGLNQVLMWGPSVICCSGTRSEIVSIDAASGAERWRLGGVWEYDRAGGGSELLIGDVAPAVRGALNQGSELMSGLALLGAPDSDPADGSLVMVARRAFGVTQAYAASAVYEVSFDGRVVNKIDLPDCSGEFELLSDGGSVYVIGDCGDVIQLSRARSSGAEASLGGARVEWYSRPSVGRPSSFASSGTPGPLLSATEDRLWLVSRPRVLEAPNKSTVVQIESISRRDGSRALYFLRLPPVPRDNVSESWALWTVVVGLRSAFDGFEVCVARATGVQRLSFRLGFVTR